MVEVLDTYMINKEITEVCECSKKQLVIISPFLKINDKLRRSIESAVNRSVKLTVIYGKNEMDKDTYEWLKALPYCNIGFLKNLHAKLILNEEAAVLSSMNLYEYSQVNNHELGVLVRMKDRKNEYKELILQSIRIINAAVKQYGKWNLEDLEKPLQGLIHKDAIFVPVSEVVGELLKEEVQDAPKRETRLRHCIRCGSVTPSYHEFVYCGRCFESWKQYCNTKYVEKEGHCYICGKPCTVSAERPACTECYRTNSDLVREKCEVMFALRNNRPGQ
jgi:hypothetical protein